MAVRGCDVGSGIIGAQASHVGRYLKEVIDEMAELMEEGNVEVLIPISFKADVAQSNDPCVVIVATTRVRVLAGTADLNAVDTNQVKFWHQGGGPLESSQLGG
jgi:hypothetical protein